MSREHPVSGRDYFTRGEVATALHRSVSTIRRLEANGELRPYRVGSEHRFKQRDVEAYRVAVASELDTANCGDVAARAYALFEAERDHRAVVVALRIAPELERTLRGQYVANGAEPIARATPASAVEIARVEREAIARHEATMRELDALDATRRQNDEREDERRRERFSDELRAERGRPSTRGRSS